MLTTTIIEILTFLAEHADLLEDLYKLIKSGAKPESIRKALKDMKVEMYDELVKEELGLPVP